MTKSTKSKYHPNKIKLSQKRVLTAIDDNKVSKEWLEEGLKAGLITQTTHTTQHQVIHDADGNACKPRIMFTIVGVPKKSNQSKTSHKARYGPKLELALHNMQEAFDEMSQPYTHTRTVSYK